jgi:putative ABC transport system substrate-binding protein
VPTAARSLRGRVDAILIGPDTAANTALASVSAAAKGAKVPLYLVAGDAKTTGATATLGPDYPSIGRQTATVAAKVLQGASPAATAFTRPESLAPAVNAATAKALGVTFAVGTTG